MVLLEMAAQFRDGVAANGSELAASSPREYVVITSCEAARRSVSEIFAAAAAPNAAVMPGTISNGT